MKKRYKLTIIAVLGIICFSMLLWFNFSLYKGPVNEKKDIVNGISLIVDYNNGSIKNHNNFTLENGKTTAFDALDKWCDIRYMDYGWGIIVVEIDGVEGGWIYLVNDYSPNVGALVWSLNDGDEVKWQKR